MKSYRLSVCKGPDCRKGGADQIFAACRERLVEKGMTARCEVYRGGCYGLCHLGPNVVLREDRGVPRDPLSREDFQLMGWEGEFHYAAMNLVKIARMIDEHIGNGRVLEELLCLPDQAPEADKASRRAG
ncbi:MAG TPA: (2Fe-2S) ferredoxin domain-containing protein [Myxococcaceae bacterium]|nr:(2Fe-2S) ferredoxin domain-containing protein [Myxococcaceae bacterium]